MAARKKRASVISHDPLEAAENAHPGTDESVEASADGDQATAAAGSKQIALGESLTIRDVTELMADITSALDLGGTVAVDGGEVESVDCAGLQLLCAMMKSAQAKGVEISWQAASECLREGVTQLGLDHCLKPGEVTAC